MIMSLFSVIACEEQSVNVRLRSMETLKRDDAVTLGGHLAGDEWPSTVSNTDEGRLSLQHFGLSIV